MFLIIYGFSSFKIFAANIEKINNSPYCYCIDENKDKMVFNLTKRQDNEYLLVVMLEKLKFEFYELFFKKLLT